MPKWRGMAHPIKKRSSHVTIVLGTGKPSKKDTFKAKEAAKKIVAEAPKSKTKTVTKKTTKKSTK
jgi:hypothetical protein